MTKLRSDETVTMQSVAVAAGVSPMTVSNTFRYPERVQEETRQRVLKIAAELGYIPNHAAGNLASGQSRVIGAVIPSIKNSSFYNYVRGMQDHVATEGYQLILKLADTLSQEASAIRTFVGLRVAGIALVGDEHESDVKTLLRKTGVPVVESWVHENPFDMAVGYSTSDATRVITELLIERGYRRIGFVGYQGDVSSRFTERVPTFKQSMEKAGLDSYRIFLVDQADGFGAGPKALEGLCAIDPDLDAIVCPTDIVAAGVLFECGRRGWKVPERLAIAGWGDYEIASEITPGLTTVQPHSYEMGQRAMSLIIERAAGSGATGMMVDTGFHIVKRASA
ncbi:LacI family DNA-binding transcriptional regulator [Neorhizobium alkalisoli]|uniref:LacI family transcriptional regulator n=1 Tax=Neorhizobium alkalisoli TaxID=528178 RepID=A0A561QPP8_9HYPH|nr:LacI family DNA-binding transcriptional regulator [Neorhizobium alkalisoli]TWF52363.1 LacI family transcriptional regulator [Neorhizobium alkalisoli]